MSRVSIKGVALGIAADVGGTILASSILLSLFAGVGLSGQDSAEDIDQAVKQAMQSGGYLIAAFIVGLSFTALGGYIAARVAKKEVYLNAGLVGVAGAFLGLLSFSSDYPLWYNIGGLILIIPAALYGGHFAERGLPQQR